MRGKLWIIKRFLAGFFPKKYILFEGNKLRNKVALTFDDGPHPEHTEKLLTILDKYNIKATFFFTGENVAAYPGITQRVARSGHLIGGHTVSHKPVSKMGPSELDKEIMNNRAIVNRVVGSNFKYFRPPWGKFNLQTLHYCAMRGITTVLWSLDTRDFEKQNIQHIVDNVINAKVKSGDVILFHDNNESTLSALPRIIKNLRDRGFEFATVEEVLK